MMAPDVSIPVARSIAELRERRAQDRRDGARTALVPTMGALHDGHLDLIRRAKATADRCIVTIFVNPTQFGPNEDFSVYPRTEQTDIAAASGAGADLIFAPGTDEMYPPGQLVRVTVPGLGDRLEGAHRPGFFTGVATIVTKLLLQALPDVALFGEKDYQQLQVIRRLVADLDIPVEIEGVPTTRESDGLAMSSRNAYLSELERRAAPALHRALCAMLEGMRRGENATDLTPAAIASLMDAGFEQPDYVAVCHGETLEPIAHIDDLEGAPGRILGAAKLGRTRLIDNVALE